MSTQRGQPHTRPHRQLSARTIAAYTADWELFGDWCAASGLIQLPADPVTVVRFLTDCSAGAATLRRRVTAIDHHHTAASTAPPGSDRAVQLALGRPALPEPADLAAALDVRLRELPSHGWTAGLFGRRDRALLVLAAAGVTSAALATAPAVALTVDAGTARFIPEPADDEGAVTLRAATDPVVCGPCASARWLRLLNLIAASSSHRRWRDALYAAPPVTADSPHLCRNRNVVTEAATVLPLLPRIDQWGYLDLAPQPVGPRSLHRLADRLLSDGPAPTRRHLPPGPPDPHTAPSPPDDTPPPVPVSAPFGAAELAVGLQRRRWQKDRAAEIDTLLDDLETRLAAALFESAPPAPA